MRKGKIYPFECRVPENSKESLESLPQQSMQRNRGKNRMGKTRDLFKKIRVTKGTTFKNGHSKGQKRYGPNRNRRY